MDEWRDDDDGVNKVGGKFHGQISVRIDASLTGRGQREIFIKI